ncbi:MAG: hypothetical protein DCC57_03150 [Chloroflexi bacterium]|nr:MAG: hypothetical protein DCC57_03150 [Chloroflexota bacterium]
MSRSAQQMLSPSDATRLHHIQEAIDLITQYVDDMELADFLLDRKTQLSVERLLEIIGEAARHLSLEIKTEHPDIPWRQIIDLRNVVSHEYFRVRPELI